MLEIFRNFVISDTRPIKQPYGTRNCINLGVIGEDKNLCKYDSKGCLEILRAKFLSRRPWWSANRDQIYQVVRESKRLRTADLTFAGRSSVFELPGGLSFNP